MTLPVSRFSSVSSPPAEVIPPTLPSPSDSILLAIEGHPGFAVESRVVSLQTKDDQLSKWGTCRVDG